MFFSAPLMKTELELPECSKWMKRGIELIRYDIIYLLTAIGLSHGDSNTHLHTNNT